MILRCLFILTVILLLLFCKPVNKNSWDGTVAINENLNKAAVTNFENTVASNREYLKERFKGHYIDRALANGDIVRWNSETFPLKVYIEYNSKHPDYYYMEVRKAFLQWQEASGNFITFKFVSQKNNADIICSFPNDFNSEKSGNGMIVGISSFNYEDNMLINSEINFATYNSRNEFWSAKEIYSTALHEIGHSLGIKGHSINREDIMYPSSSSSIYISSNDINTLKLIYSIIPDVSNKEFSQDVKENFLTADDVFGKGQSRYKIELESTKDDIRHTGVAISHKSLRLGYLYYKTAQYTQAKKVLEPMLETHPNEPQVYKTLAKVYEKQKDDEALNRLYVRAEKVFPDNPPIKKN